MRKVLVKESDLEQVNGMILKPGSVEFQIEPPYPVSLNNHWENIVGKVHSVKREEDGRITAEFDMRAGYETLPDGCEASVYLNDIVVVGKEITHGRLRGITLTPIYGPVRETQRIPGV